MIGSFLLTVAMLAAGAVAPMDHVILVSIDGLSGPLLGDLVAGDPSSYPAFRRLLDEGAATLNARADYTHTVTLPNHTCMITGRPVSQPLGQLSTVHHGYTTNVDPLPGDTLHNQGNPNLAYVPSAFDVAHDHGLGTSLFASKSKFVIFDQSYTAVTGAPDQVGADDGRDKIDVYHAESSATNPSHAAGMHDAFLAHLAAGPAEFSFVHYRDLDSAGHYAGWGSALWNAWARNVDGYLGEILDFVVAHPEIMGRTVVIVTADHGGLGTDHSAANQPVIYTIPFLVWGTDVPAGADLYGLNPLHRADPGTGRPDYNATLQPIRNGDAGNLALDLLGLPAIAGSTIDGDQDLIVTTAPTDVPDAGLPAALVLRGYPNPFNPRTMISFALPRAAMVTVGVYDAAGRLVRGLHSGHLAAGTQDLVWDGNSDGGVPVAGGVYFVRLGGAGRSEPLKVTLVK